MNVLICGAGKGSWQMRGCQLGAAIGARVTSSPTDADFEWADRVVLIKKHATTFAQRAHRFGKPIIWDALDFWSQPAHNAYKEDAATLLLQSHIKVIKPALVIGATKAMTEAARAFCPAEYLPHHSWSGLVPTPPREHVSVVAYEGNPIYLGRWHGWLKEACEKRGWSFVVNPSNLSDADIIVAFRDGQWDGWICREWKSGVKIVNAIAAGRTIITQRSAAFDEIDAFGSTVDTCEQLSQKLDFWGQFDSRRQLYPIAVDEARRYILEAVSARYTEILATVEAPCTA